MPCTVRSLFAAILALSLSICCLAKERSKPSDATLLSISAKGILLAGYDYAAWHASDVVEAVASKSDPPSRYIGTKTDHGWVMDFGSVDESRDKFLVRYEAIQGSTPEQFTSCVFAR